MNLTFFLEHACNLRCTYCYTGKKFRRVLSDEVARKALELVLREPSAKFDVAFFGGEPLLRRDRIKEIVALVREELSSRSNPPDVRFILNTNLTLLDEKSLELLVREKFVVSVSLDGPADVHDGQRPSPSGHGCYERVSANLRLLEARGIPFQLHAVVTPQSAASLGRTASELFRYRAVSFSLGPAFSENWADRDIAAFRTGMQHAAAVWGAEFRAGRLRRFEPLQTKLASNILGGCATSGRCDFALPELVVAPSGNLYTCGELVGEDRDDTHRIGHVDTGIDHSRVAALRKKKANIDSVCGVCDLRSRCSSDCGCRQVAASGSLGVIDGLLCELEEATIEAADWLHETMMSERVEAFERFTNRANWKLRPDARLLPLRRSGTQGPAAPSSREASAYSGYHLR